MLVNKLGVDVLAADVLQTSFLRVFSDNHVYCDLNNSALDFLI